MGDSQNTSTTSTTPNNPAITNTTNKLLGGIDAAWAKGPSVWEDSLYAGQGDTTKSGISSLIGSANNPAYSAGLAGAMQSFGKTASGANIGMNDPGYATIRNKLSNDVMTSTNDAFNKAGLFGSDNNQKQAASGLADSLGALDYQQYNDSLDRQAQAPNLLSQIYQASQQPASTLLSAGALQDANAQATKQGNYEYYTRANNAQTDYLAKLSSILAGNAQTSGNTTTQTTPTTPWWQSAIGIGLGAL